MIGRILKLFSLAILLLSLSCSGPGNVAGGNSRLFLTAEPSEIGLKGTSTLTVTGSDENGAPLADGTTVSFSVNESGRVTPNFVQLVGGKGTSTYFATTSSGEITVTATSGSVQAKATITVADQEERKKVFVSAEPATLASGGGTSIIS